MQFPDENLLKRLIRARRILRPPPKMGLIEWADTYRVVAAKTSATPGRWSTATQPCAYGPMAAISDNETHTITVCAATQLIKTEFLLNVASYYIAQDPSPILFLRPSQGDAAAFSKERFGPTVEATPVLRALVSPPRAHDSDNTIALKNFPGGSLAFCGANSPTDLSSRPRRVILADECDKYPPSAGGEGDPLALAEERASTYHNLGRAKFVRCCSPTVTDASRIMAEYLKSDQRKLYLTCPHCREEITLNWSHVAWDKDAEGNHLPDSSHIICSECGAAWTENDRLAAIDALQFAPNYGWKATAPFTGHAGFVVSKLYSKRHSLADMAKEFLSAKKDRELLRKFFNTCLAETFGDEGEMLDGSNLIHRAEPFGPNNLPDDVILVTGFCDVQDQSLHVLLVGWGTDEEAWVFQRTIIDLNPTLPQAWRELESILRSEFTTVNGRKLRIGSFGIDVGGHHGATVFSFCRKHKGKRIYPCKGMSGKRQLFGARAKRTKVAGDVAWLTGVDTAKDIIYSRLKLAPIEPGKRQPGYIHFSDGEAFDEDFYAELTSERKETRKMKGQPYTVWVLPSGKHNEALDCMCGALIVRRALPRRIEAKVEYALPPLPVEPEPRVPPVSAPRQIGCAYAPVPPPKPPPQRFVPDGHGRVVDRGPPSAVPSRAARLARLLAK